LSDAVEKVPNFPTPIFRFKKNLTGDCRFDALNLVTEVAGEFIVRR